ncbi:MAG: twin-arginine translocase subunit TatC [Carbonactinosporaceae bacterium]
MPLIEHIRELRGRLLKAVAAVILTTTIAYFFYTPIIDFLSGPVCDLNDIRGVGKAECGGGVLVISGVLGAFSLKLKVSLAAGLVGASPVWLYQLWAFLAPGLHRHERRYTVAFVLTGVPLFLAGAAVSYVVMSKAVDLLLSEFTPEQASNQLQFDDYLSFVIRMILVFGLAFELPLILVLLNLGGVLSAERMTGWWRGMILGIVAFAAVATPTGDPLTMTFLAAPVAVLYFIAIGIARLNDARRRRRELADPLSQLSDDEISSLGPDDGPEPPGTGRRRGRPDGRTPDGEDFDDIP